LDRTSVEWHGYIPAVTTTFAADGSLDLEGWAELVEWIVCEGVHGIVVAGSSGEWFTLERQERKELFAVAREQVAGRIPVLGCCNALRPVESLDFALEAAALGLDGIILAPPPYAVPNEEELVAFYSRISAEVPLPLCLYNWPRGTNVDMRPELIERLAGLDTVVAIKNSTGSLEAFLAAFFLLKDRIRIFGFGTDERAIELIREHGGDGTIGAGAVLGREHPAFFEAIWAGELDEARRLGKRDQAFFDFAYYPDFSPKFASAQAVMKAALNLRGLPGGYPRPPYLPLTEEQVGRVRAFLEELELLPAAAV
jgi:4-hydroxy-tetrahydrodipicolinate synthase